MTSVAALTPTSIIASAAPLFSIAITLAALASTSSGASCAFPAVEMIPVPIGFVSTSRSPGLADELVIMRSGWMKPVTAMPYFGSSSVTVWPPMIVTPASAAFSAPPRKMVAKTSNGRSSGIAATFSAVTGRPPIA